MTATDVASRMSRTPLVAVAHGSRDPRSAETISRLLDVVRSLRPGLDVRPAFLDLSRPRLVDALAGVAADGYRRAVVVPLLLGSAFHARVDVPAMTTEATRRVPGLRVHVSDVLGPRTSLEVAARRRLWQAGADPDDQCLGVVLTGAGSAYEPANTALREVAQRWAGATRWVGVTAAFATAAQPDVRTAITGLRARGARRIAIASWFLAPGLLPSRVRDVALAADPDIVLADPLGDDIAVAEVVLRRYLDGLGLSARGPRPNTRHLSTTGAS